MSFGHYDRAAFLVFFAYAAVQDLHPEEAGRYINFTHALWSVGVLVTVLCSGALLTLGVSWRGLLFLAGLATAPFWPSVQSYATDRLPAADTTMLLILLSCAGIRNGEAEGSQKQATVPERARRGGRHLTRACSRPVPAIHYAQAPVTGKARSWVREP